MVKYGEEIFVEAIKKAMASVAVDWEKSQTTSKPGGDPALRDEMRRLTASLRSMQSRAIADRQHQQVRANIERRAELREKTAVRFPNIAGLMAGQAPGPIGLMGSFQRQMSKPFKSVWDYKKAQGESAEFSRRMKDKFDADPFYEMTQDEEDEQTELKERESGAKKRAKSGFGKNIMGRKMQGMIGKVGKFMESSKGQGMLAGGMLGVSILTMVIKKAMEASPMLQQMLKIMNVAMTLFLRPIGDFIGGMLKPIMLFFLREVAVPMLRAGKGMIKFGEAVGRGILGFILKPMEVITKAIVGALSFFPFFGQSAYAQFWANYEPIGDWMLDKRIDTLIAVINSKLPAGVAPITKKDIQEFVAAGGDLEEFSSRMVRGPGGTFGAGQSPSAETLQGFMNLFPKEMAELVRLQQAKISADYEIIHEKLKAMGIEFGGVVTESSAATESLAALAFVARTGLIPEFSSLAVTIEFLRKAIFQGLMPSWMAKLAEWADEGKITKEELERAMRYMIEQGLHGWGKPLKYIEMSLIKAKDAFGLVEEDALIVRDHMENTRRYAEEGSDWMSQATAALKSGFLKITAFVNAISRPEVPRGGGSPRPSPGGSNWHTSQTGALQSAINASKQAHPKAWAKSLRRSIVLQHGGMINEPIWGVGESGQSYTFGEAGPERVMPTGASTRGGIGDVTINVNVDSINSDVDLEKIKPVIERALQEVHSRRGII